MALETNTAGQTDVYSPATAIAPPSLRPLKVYAYDPSRSERLGNSLQIQVRYERLAPGPIGRRFAVVDYDGARNTYYLPVDLDDPLVLIRGGLDPSESDPRFHQQMLYAVATETMERFEAALGRRVHWRRPIDDDGSPIYDKPNRLYLHPHAFCQANAFYCPDAHAILFGYFKANDTDEGRNLPGQTVFTCLSHDIVAHETTHALVDGVRGYFMEPTNIDVPAFHEAFADLVALFRHFAHSETLVDTLQKTGGRLYALDLKSASASALGVTGAAATPQIQADIAEQNPLVELATQFGEASGMRGGLRSALGTPPNSDDIRTKTEPHDRGSILVAAVFDAFFTIYQARATPLFQVYRAGGHAGDDIHPVLAQMLADLAAQTAELFFRVCVRSLDYCPPVDLTYGDFMRAMITADFDLYPDDTLGVRDAIMQAFRLRGVTPEGARYFSELGLCWPSLAPDALPAVEGLIFGDPNGLTRDEADRNGDILRKWVDANRAALGFDPKGPAVEVPSFHPVYRTDATGQLKIDMIVEAVQTKVAPLAPQASQTTPLRSGVTLIIAKPPVQAGKRPAPHVRYAIAKHMTPARESRQRAMATLEAVKPKRSGRFAIDFAMIHGGV
ncbi:MAG TPA: hypothetical protein VMT68_20050 [Caulobacteraceae bacterium]|nr:hypothetical protein [Caulobacteraceae bacterium]